MAYKKVITESEAIEHLTDALTDLLHVHDGDEIGVGEVEAEVWKVARTHHANEQPGNQDGIEVEVIRDVSDELEWQPDSQDPGAVTRSIPERFVIVLRPTSRRDCRYWLTDLASNHPPNPPTGHPSLTAAKEYAKGLVRT